MSIQELKKKLKNAPKRPGVYLYTAGRHYLYVGKAVNLRSRLLNYPDTKDVRILKMIAEAKNISWEETPTEIEALILESRLIKKHRPKFNIVMRDDKQYFYVVFSYEEFPRITLSHQPAAGSTFIGPFTDGAPLKNVLRLLRRHFPYCTCKQKHNVRCLNAHIGKCFGFCCLKTGAMPGQVAEYIRSINAIKEVLSGRKNTLVKKLKSEMKSTAQSGALETAIIIRKQIANLERVFENASVIRNFETTDPAEDIRELLKAESPIRRIEGYDIANIQGQHATGSMVVFIEGNPEKSSYKRFRIKTVKSQNDIAMLTEILSRRFAHLEWPLPDAIVVDGGRAQLTAVSASMKKSGLPAGTVIPVIAITKNEYHRAHHIYISGRKNAVSLRDLPEIVRNLLIHIDNEAHRFAISHYRRLHRLSLGRNNT